MTMIFTLRFFSFFSVRLLLTVFREIYFWKLKFFFLVVFSGWSIFVCVCVFLWEWIAVAGLKTSENQRISKTAVCVFENFLRCSFRCFFFVFLCTRRIFYASSSVWQYRIQFSSLVERYFKIYEWLMFKNAK